MIAKDVLLAIFLARRAVRRIGAQRAVDLVGTTAMNSPSRSGYLPSGRFQWR